MKTYHEGLKVRSHSKYFSLLKFNGTISELSRRPSVAEKEQHALREAIRILSSTEVSDGEYCFKLTKKGKLKMQLFRVITNVAIANSDGEFELTIPDMIKSEKQRETVKFPYQMDAVYMISKAKDTLSIHHWSYHRMGNVTVSNLERLKEIACFIVADNCPDGLYQVHLGVDHTWKLFSACIKFDKPVDDYNIRIGCSLEDVIRGNLGTPVNLAESLEDVFSQYATINSSEYRDLGLLPSFPAFCERLADDQVDRG